MSASMLYSIDAKAWLWGCGGVLEKDGEYGAVGCSSEGLDSEGHGSASAKVLAEFMFQLHGS